MKRKDSLKKNSDISALVKSGKRCGGRYYVLYYQAAPAAKIAFAAPKKLGKAVDRNYEKRVMRASAAVLWPQTGAYWLLLVAKPAAKSAGFKEKQAEIKYLFTKAGILHAGKNE